MPVASSAPERHRTLRLVQYSANGMARFSARIARKVCRWFGVSPPEPAETSLACRARFPTVRGPVRSCLRPCVEHHRGGASSGPGSRRRDGVYPCSGRTRRCRARANTHHVDSHRTAQGCRQAASDVRRGARQNLRSRRIFGPCGPTRGLVCFWRLPRATAS